MILKFLVLFNLKYAASNTYTRNLFVLNLCSVIAFLTSKTLTTSLLFGDVRTRCAGAFTDSNVISLNGISEYYKTN